MENLIHKKLNSIVERRYALVLFMVLFLILDSLVFILPYYLKGYTIPVGWDTPWYIRNMRLIEEQGIFSLFTKTREINFFCILEYLFASIFNVSFTVTAMVVPIVMALLFPLINFQIVKKLTKSNELSLLAMLLTIIDYNIVRMAGILFRNLFCLLLIEIAIFLVLPDFLKQPSKRSFSIFAFLVIIAGISQIETFAIAMIVLSFLLFFYLKKRAIRFAKLLLLCMLVPASLVILLEAPFLASFIDGHITFNPTISPHRQNLVAQPGNYALSLGMGLIPLLIVGTHFLFKNATNYKEPLFQFLFFWNFTVVIGSFLPVFNVRVPGWRFLLLVVFPPVAILGFAKLLGRRLSSPRKLLHLITLTVLIGVSLTGIILNQNKFYRPWITEGEYSKLVQISDHAQNNACMVVLYLDRGVETFDYAEFYRNWVWAIIGTKTNVYFGDVEFLLQSIPTNFENPYMNITSDIFWDELENFTLNDTRIYVIEEWYEKSLNENCLAEVESGIYYMELN